MNSGKHSRLYASRSNEPLTLWSNSQNASSFLCNTMYVHVCVYVCMCVGMYVCIIVGLHCRPCEGFPDYDVSSFPPNFIMFSISHK